MTILVVLVIVVLLAAVLFGVYRTVKSERSGNQEKFVRGTADSASVDGDYIGNVPGLDVSWQGKTFNQAESSGINRFKEGDRVTTNYPFKTYVAKGLRDKDTDVIVLDYNQPGNPWWLRFIVDEMVSTAPNTYLGKVHIRALPRVVFTMGYFTLEK
ncbi:MAG TPA: hypothetical protein VJC05_02615 [Candidatus Andersenbacteria bacterium]|nr:hypothetical protein [Candidatus Andersenbacteria bacterium]